MRGGSTPLAEFVHSQTENETAKLPKADVSHAARGWDAFPG